LPPLALLKQHPSKGGGGTPLVLYLSPLPGAQRQSLAPPAPGRGRGK